MTDLMERKVISLAEVAKHRDKASGVWMVIHNDVYDVSSFLEEHPGGEDSLLDVAGKVATQDFEDVGHSDDARELMKKYVIGTLPPEEKTAAPSVPPDSKFRIEPPCCPHLPRSVKSEKTWRTFDGSPCRNSLASPSVKPETKLPTTPRPEGRVNAIYVPRERRPRGRPCESGKREEPPPRSNLKWAVLALAGALVVGFVLKKYLSK